MGAASKLGNFGPAYEAKKLGRLGLSPRQLEMNQLWSYYMCAQYDEYKMEWDGSQRLGHIERVAIASGRNMPQGFSDVSGQVAPLRFRRPSAPYHLAKVIVDRFTSLLFSEKRHPKLNIEGDEQSEDYVETLADVGRLWPTMMQARTFGGACGSVAVGFQFLDGRPYFEVHDPRWVFPYFRDRTTLELSALEKRYIFFQEVWDKEEERFVEVPFWYRRVIDKDIDAIFKPAPVGDGAEPTWQMDRVVEHKLGFCPVVWIQNMPVVGDIDGLPDCHGIYDMLESIDVLNAQAERGLIANCDPTLVITSDADMHEIKKGSDNAIRVPQGGSVTYLEISGSGPKAAREMATEYKANALEVAQCYLEGESTVAQTATEIERRCSSMLAKADILREQYGERGVKPLLRKVLEAAKKLGSGMVINGTIRKYMLDLPPKVVGQANGSQAATVERQLGPGPHRVQLQWPRYFEPSLQDVQGAVSAAAAAKAGSLIDDEHASKFVAEYFQVEDLIPMLKKIKEQQDALGVSMENMIGGEDFG